MPLTRKGNLTSLSLFALILIAASSSAQTPLSLGDAVRRGVDASPSVRASTERLASARAALSRAQIGFRPQLEFAPGLGFTNGNSLLSQRIDITGVRRGASRLAQAELASAQAALGRARQDRAFEISAAYYDLVRARGEETAAAESARLSRELVALVRKRVEVGEAPQVQVTRASVEASRVEQELVRARGAVTAQLTTLRALVGDEALTPESLPDELPPLPEPGADLVPLALTPRAEIVEARTRVAIAEAEGAVARSNRGPSLFASVAADIWSLDRSPFQSRNLGLQAFLTVPLADRGIARTEDEANRALVRAAEADLAATELSVRTEVARAAVEVATRREVAANYRSTILPEAQTLFETTRTGYEQGLVTLIEVLEAQRTLRLTRTEGLTATYDALRAELELRRAAGTLAPATQPQENPL